MSDDINIFRCLDFIRDTSSKYAKAKAERIYLEEFRKSKKSLLMRDAEIAGHKSAATQEREAYAHEEYVQLLEALRSAVESEETLRWQITAASAKIEVWRSLSANERMEKKVL
ncbi:hypothetical protein UFOVP150_51 [uncultured Caudovirales phage]|uniref:Uncharacterized protein n=1 Tax=uncultured Caudovirales phage TaxID=2100421 RepID=A0A6J7W853_9CAUD|nr:hypothetical protein UFOVP150_51 [uncultured Caudovirales phage]